MSREDDQIISALGELKKELRERRNIRSREEGKLSQLKATLLKEVGTDDVEEAEEKMKELLLEIEKNRGVLESDLRILRNHYGI
jgi:hypothetical protein